MPDLAMLDYFYGDEAEQFTFYRIGGQDFPLEVVKSRLLKLNSEHISYVVSSLKSNTTKVRNIRAYLLTALYNAPTTISSYYTALVNHDLYGGG